MHDCKRLTSHPLFSIYRLVTAWHHRVQYPICMSKPIKQWTKPWLVGLYRGLYYPGGIIINHYKDPYETTSIIERLNSPCDLAIWFLQLFFAFFLAANGDPPWRPRIFSCPGGCPQPQCHGRHISNTNTPKISKSTFLRNKWFEKVIPTWIVTLW